MPQFDFLLPTLTVAETLRYSALLRLPKDTQGHEVQVRRTSDTCIVAVFSTRSCPGTAGRQPPVSMTKAFV